MGKTAEGCGVPIVTGDTKVVESGAVDQMIMVTSAIGRRSEYLDHNIGIASRYRKVDSNWMTDDNIRPGDAIIVTGDVGRHGCTILLSRDDFGIEADVTSDCAPLWGSVEAMLDVTRDIHVIRDATRGGVGTVLYEIAAQSGVSMQLDAQAIPVDPAVGGVCRMLGLEPLYLACEGRLVVIAPAEVAPALVEALRACPYSQGAAIIGTVTEDKPGWVVLNTEIGTQTLLPQPTGELLPRIC
jgi:hydrogenase expression/formation protein HypE